MNQAIARGWKSPKVVRIGGSVLLAGIVGACGLIGSPASWAGSAAGSAADPVNSQAAATGTLPNRGLAVAPGPAVATGGSVAPAMAAMSVSPSKSRAGTPAAGDGRSWRIQGDLAEACTCSVPCTCNFGGTPSPHHYCYAIFSLDIEEGHYGTVKLNGLHLAAGNAAKGSVWYIDESATTEQGAALRAIGEQINTKLVAYWKGVDPEIVKDPQFTLLGFETTKITQRATSKESVLKIGDVGGFVSDYILGIDGKTPVIVENNWSWNIKHGIKGKTKQLKYKDAHGNLIDTTGTNANQGKFDWSDQTPIYLR